MLRALIRRLKRATTQATKGAKARAVVLRTGVRRARPRTHREDLQYVAFLSAAHARLNAERFQGALKPVAIRVSRRMVRRLGHYAPGAHGSGPEIAVSARHLRRDVESRVLETLLHEMVHQWQHEQGLPIDHGADFRKICVAVGAAPRARATPSA